MLIKFASTTGVSKDIPRELNDDDSADVARRAEDEDGQQTGEHSHPSQRNFWESAPETASAALPSRGPPDLTWSALSMSSSDLPGSLPPLLYPGQRYGVITRSRLLDKQLTTVMPSQAPETQQRYSP